MLFWLFTGLLGRGLMPVSYTHLDVYKRQVLCCLACEDDPVFQGSKRQALKKYDGSGSDRGFTWNRHNCWSAYRRRDVCRLILSKKAVLSQSTTD